MERTDALRKPDRFRHLLNAAGLLVPVEQERWEHGSPRYARSMPARLPRGMPAQPAQIRDAVRAERLGALAPLVTPPPDR